ncbi:SGNH/GDSL hydrolase family protein [Pedobacter sp.]|uniref:SGNH/GDSL hydrolase family protein n=1 Tax=Pedobacter sp. TaxID=1411316 RepID=UPI003D7FC0F5
MKIFVYASIVLLVVLSSCEKLNAPEVVEAKVKYSNILILGNSITQAPENKAIGWNANWGMAASKPEFDFVHLLSSKFISENPSAKITAKNIAAFEVDYENYDLNQLKTYTESKPDLVIIRIGENVTQEAIGFDARYKDLISLIKSNNPNVKIMAVGSFWGNEAADKVMAGYSEFISLKSLGTDMTNYAWGIYEDHGIASHPGDKGMKAIAEMIWAAI